MRKEKAPNSHIHCTAVSGMVGIPNPDTLCIDQHLVGAAMQPATLNQAAKTVKQQCCMLGPRIIRRLCGWIRMWFSVLHGLFPAWQFNAIETGRHNEETRGLTSYERPGVDTGTGLASFADVSVRRQVGIVGDYD
ncbi:hypothetical protein IAQ61_000794 [Plenodomus lingam]|uniref:Uncharacterized protein n=1 Tax=Leptosphaeria maculans (strain JN3 / isolate v23.1.3 / race Av1-4-5-6-7-8) TaxID=985895 RepID=E5A632_LEPMJ|nr:predicted protein [Plenodomus lingam JN3]KAH9880502.1 hypothetical protein IAQ61_000794 [Plenodomus lingam]CBX99077.1 predicted protein [Plenodomus lingam JN3]